MSSSSAHPPNSRRLKQGAPPPASSAHDHRPPKRIRRHVRAVFVVAACATAGLWTAFTPKDENDYYYKVNKGLEIFGQVYREVTHGYVDEVDPDRFIAAGIDGMLATLDPYTVYQRGDANDVDLLTTGSYGGIGITVGLREGVITVTDVIDGYSAQQEGVRIGDRLLTIDGRDVSRGPVEMLRGLTRGEPGTTLLLTVERGTIAGPLRFKLTRDNIKIRSVTYSRMLRDGVGYVRLERFNATAGNEIRAAIQALQGEGSLQGLVLDLRDNPGGLLEAAVDVTSLFLPPGSVVVSTRGRDTAENRVYHSKTTPLLKGLPLVVLINENSASAAEIVAGALQDQDAAVIMGTRSFGKGLVQTVRRLPYETSLKITTSRYYTPSGRSIQKINYADGRSSALRHSEPTTTFRTAHGRAVEGLGGIAPDTMVSRTGEPAIVAQLRNGSIFFKFATRHTATMQTLGDDFVVSDSLLAGFLEFVTSDSVATMIDSSSTMLSKRLEIAADTEGLGRDVARQIRELRSAVTAERRRLLKLHAEHVRRELYREIVARFRGQRERRSATLASDEQVDAAHDLLRSAQQVYRRLLSAR